jgi:hypothetical protein
VVSGSADDPVATVTVTDALDPTLAFTGTPDGSAGWWRSDPADIVVGASDETGVASVATRLDGGPWTTTAGSSVTVHVTGDGQHTLQARALDTTGNLSAVVHTSVGVDAADPVSRAGLGSDRRVTVLAADATSGVAEVETRVDGGAWTTYTAPVEVGAAGATVSYRAVDVAGNVEESHDLVVPEVGSELPVATVLAVTDGAATYGGTVRVTVRVTGPSGAPTGTVRVLSGDRQVGSGTLGPDGRVQVSVDTTAVGVGDHALLVRYDGSPSYRPGEDTARLTVRRASSTIEVSVSRPNRHGRGAVATVRFATDPAGVGPVPVHLVLSKGGTQKESVWLTVRADGTAVWRLPRLGPGGWTIGVTATATSTVDGSADTDSLRVRRRR